MVQILTIFHEMGETNVMELSFHEVLRLNDSAPRNTTVLETSAILDGAMNIGTVIILFITMISLGCTMEVPKIKVSSQYIFLRLCSLNLLDKINTIQLCFYPGSHNEAKRSCHSSCGPVWCHAPHSLCPGQGQCFLTSSSF